MITFPVSNEATFTYIDKGKTYRRRRWLRADLEDYPDGRPKDLVVMEEKLNIELIDPATQKLGPGHWVDDPANEVTTWTRLAIPLTQDELDDLAEEEAGEQKGQAVKDAVATIRSWADQQEGFVVTQQNAVSTVQSLVDRTAVFFDRFADYIEYLERRV